VRVAAAVANLLVLAALSGAGAEAVVLVHLELILLREATLPLTDADVLRLRIVLDVLDRELASVREEREVMRKVQANGNSRQLTCSE
jgi:hypothetical protein